MAGEPKAPLMFNLVFFVVLVSVMVRGTTLPLVCRWLGVLKKAPVESKELKRAKGSELLEVTWGTGSEAVGKMMM